MKNNDIKKIGEIIGYNALLLCFIYLGYSIFIFKNFNLIITSSVILIITILSFISFKISDKNIKNIIGVINISLTTILILFNLLVNLNLI